MLWKDITVTVDAESEILCETSGEGQDRICVRWTGNGEPAAMKIEWSMPLIDIQYEWYPDCGFNRSLHTDWNPAEESKISSSAPVFCFYNAAGRNRLTTALSDARTPIRSIFGVREENSHLICRFEIPLDRSKGRHEYSVVVYRNDQDVSFAEALRRVSNWWERDCKIDSAAVPEAARETVYSCWYSFHQATIAADIEAECACARALGMKTVIVDDGWQTDDGSRGYAYCGDWEAAEKKIPDMKAHVERVHALGMKYMLWYSVPFVGVRSKHFKTFRGKFLRYIERLQAAVLDPRYPEVRQYLIETYEKALKDWNLDGLKLDFIDSFSAEADPMPPRKDGMDCTLVEEGVDRLMKGALERLRAVKPDVLIEFRQNYIGPAMRGFGNMFRVGDCPNDPISNRVGTIDLRMISGSTAVHSDMLMWNPEDTVQSAALQLLSVLFAVPQISVKLEELNDEHRQMLGFWLEFIEKHRDLLQYAPLEVEAPQNLYPLVRAEKDGRAVIAVYDGGKIADIGSEIYDAFLINASFDKRMTICCGEPRRFKAEIRDCAGRWVDTEKISADEIALLSVPACGMVHLTEI